MTTHLIFIDGSEGTTGLQIRERLEGRTDVELITIDPPLRKNPNARMECINAADIAILCLPDAAAREAARMIYNPDVKIIDASTAHRTDPNWVYGFPELSKQQENTIRKSKRVSNPGCYATAAIALLAPLVGARLIPAYRLYSINGLSGYSGAGRATIEACEGKTYHPIPPGLQLYSLGTEHKHVPEIVQHAGLTQVPVFSPTIVNTVRQGMIVTIPVDLSTFKRNGRNVVTPEAIHTTWAVHYEGQQHIKVMPRDSLVKGNGKLALDGLAGKDHMELYVAPYDRADAALLIARLDNLGKGASGAAIQNLNLMMG